MDVLQLPNTNKPEAYKLWSDLRDMLCDLVSSITFCVFFQLMFFSLCDRVFKKIFSGFAFTCILSLKLFNSLQIHKYVVIVLLCSLK